jgi:HSP20 family molecular chaperone IbpA
MNCTRFYRVSKVLGQNLKSDWILAGSQAPASTRFRSTSLDTYFFNNASSLIRNLENEFDRIRSSMFKNVLSPSLSMPALEYPLGADKFASDIVKVDDQGNRKLNLELDLTGFDPAEINIETQGQVLTLSAKKEKKVYIFEENFLRIIRFISVFFLSRRTHTRYASSVTRISCQKT